MTETVDRQFYFTTTEMLDRGWARSWLEPLLGAPVKPAGKGNAKFWAKAAVTEVESNPVFIEARAQLDEIDRRVRYVTKDHEIQALRAAVDRFKAGELPPVGKLEVGPLPEPTTPSEFPKAAWSADALTLTWEIGSVVIPLPFIEALRRGMGETGERITLAINTVINDWRHGHVVPEKLQWGRNYFLAAIRNVLSKLQELERQAPEKPRPTDDQPFAPPQERTLH